MNLFTLFLLLISALFSFCFILFKTSNYGRQFTPSTLFLSFFWLIYILCPTISEIFFPDSCIQYSNSWCPTSNIYSQSAYIISLSSFFLIFFFSSLKSIQIKALSLQMLRKINFPRLYILVFLFGISLLIFSLVLGGGPIKMISSVSYVRLNTSVDSTGTANIALYPLFFTSILLFNCYSEVISKFYITLISGFRVNILRNARLMAITSFLAINLLIIGGRGVIYTYIIILFALNLPPVFKTLLSYFKILFPIKSALRLVLATVSFIGVASIVSSFGKKILLFLLNILVDPLSATRDLGSFAFTNANEINLLESFLQGISFPFEALVNSLSSSLTVPYLNPINYYMSLLSILPGFDYSTDLVERTSAALAGSTSAGVPPGLLSALYLSGGIIHIIIYSVICGFFLLFLDEINYHSCLFPENLTYIRSSVFIFSYSLFSTVFNGDPSIYSRQIIFIFLFILLLLFSLQRVRSRSNPHV